MNSRTSYGAREKRYVDPLTIDDIALIGALKAERRRLQEELSVIAKVDPRGHCAKLFEHRQQIRRELKQLTDASLATKFETSVYAIRNVSED